MEIFLKSNHRGARSLRERQMHTTLAGKTEAVSGIGFHPLRPLQVVLQRYVRHSLSPSMNAEHIKVCVERKQAEHQLLITLEYLGQRKCTISTK